MNWKYDCMKRINYFIIRKHTRFQSARLFWRSSIVSATQCLWYNLVYTDGVNLVIASERNGNNTVKISNETRVKLLTSTAVNDSVCRLTLWCLQIKSIGIFAHHIIIFCIWKYDGTCGYAAINWRGRMNCVGNLIFPKLINLDGAKVFGRFYFLWQIIHWTLCAEYWNENDAKMKPFEWIK